MRDDHFITPDQRRRMRQRRRMKQRIFRVLPGVVVAVLAGILIALLVLGITGPYEAEAAAVVDTAKITAAEAAPEAVEATTAAETDADEETVPAAGTAARAAAGPEKTPETAPGTVSLGTFTLTAYCSCRKCCGRWSGGPTKSGTMPAAGRTIAVDPTVIPLGTRVIIGGNEYIAEDTGSAVKGDHIDIYFDSHEEAARFGRQRAEVSVIR